MFKCLYLLRTVPNKKQLELDLTFIGESSGGETSGGESPCSCVNLRV